MAKKWKKLGSLLRSGAEQPQELDSAPAEEGEKAPPVQAAIQAEDAEIAEAARLHEMKGALLQVWQKYMGPIVPPPRLSLLGERSAQELHRDLNELTRARVRITAQLEQDAKKRVRAIEAAEKQAAEAEKKRQEAGAKEGDEPIRASLDAVCHVYLSLDKMVAWMLIFPPLGEGGLPAEGVGNAIRESGVTSGIDTVMVGRVLQEKPYFKLIPIAIGSPPVEGSNGVINELYPRKLAPEVKITENGDADYRALNYVQQVEKDDVLCEIIPPRPGTPGLRVDGKVVEPKRVSAAKVPRGSGTAITEDGLRLVATMAGHLEYVSDAFHVRPLLEIKGDVDYSTGNIDFHGDVHVFGDVRENFLVRATGTITVDGLVEAAIVEAGGDLVITRGVVGDNRALLRSKGNVRVKYLENCVVYAGKGVYADCIMTSQIFSDETISVVSGRGSVIGGALTAAYTIKALMIGAQSGRRTELTLGILPYVQSEMQNALEDLDSITRESRELEKQLAWLESNQGQEGISSKLAKAKMRKSVLGMKEQQIIKRQERLVGMLVDLSKCRLECEVIYPVTSLTVQDVTQVITETHRHFHVAYDVRTGELREVL